MLALPHTNSWGFVYTNQDNGSFTPGTSVVPGASSAEGSWTEIGPDASITADIHYVQLHLSDSGAGATARQHFLDFGWDPAGGTSYVAFFQNLACGGVVALDNAATGRLYHFPCKIPAGSAIAVRMQGAAGTAGTCRVNATFWGKPSRPELWRGAAYSETLGAGASTLGTSFTPGNASWGAWASLGTTTKTHFWAQLGAQINNATMQNDATHIQLGIGDGTNMHIITDHWMVTSTGERHASTLQTPCTWEIPSGATLYVRGNNSAAPVSGYNATAVLFGG